MADAALIIASPWARTGSANIFAAQSLFLSKRGCRTAMLLTPHHAAQRRKFWEFWSSALDGMRFQGVDLLCNASTNRRMRRWRSLSFWQWLLHGRDSQLAIMARYAGAAKLPPELISFLEANVLHVIIVNHCFQMEVAAKICRRLERNGRPRPIVILEAHDVQSDLYSAGGINNVFRGRPDDLASLLRDELRLAAAADIVTHVTDEDMQRLGAALKSTNQLVLATLDPANEKQLLGLDDSGTQPIDFMFVGNNNPGNASSVAWFLNEVIPRIDDSYSVAIVGSIADHIKATNPELFNRFRRYFRGEVADIVQCYRDAAVVVVPTKFATGTSIKTIEALAAGKPIVATTTALRGLPDARCEAVRACDCAAEFAEAMLDVHRSRHDLGTRSRALYLQYFSNAKYFERWDRVLAEHCAGQPLTGAVAHC